MSIQLCVSTASIGSNWRAMLPKLKALGFDGIEIAPDAGVSAADIKKAVEEAGLKIAVLATRIVLNGHNAKEINQALADAQAVGASAIRVFGGQRHAGETAGGAACRIAASLGSESKVGGVRILVQNGYDFTAARDLWALCQATGHDLGVCWDFGVGAATKESAVTSVSTLNSRIAHVHVWDAKAAAPSAAVALGTGDVIILPGLDRLRGIGYSGWVSYAPPHRQQDEAAWEAELKQAAEQIKLWVGLIKPAPAVEPAKPATAAAKPAAPAAAKPATPAAAKPAAPATPAAPAAEKPAAPAAAAEKKPEAPATNA